LSFRRTLIVALCGCAIAATACGGGSDTGEAPDDESIPTATLPAELPEPMIVGGGIVQPGGGLTYTVKSGDTMASIAESLGISLEDLMAANPGVDPSTLHAGDTLKLPSGTEAPVVTPAPAPTEGAAPTEDVEEPTEEPAPTEAPPTEEPVATNTPTSLGQSYVVQSGDIPETIAAQFGITTQALLAANPGINPTNLQVGQVLIIPPAESGG
jgi:LysM repeat protein